MTLSSLFWVEVQFRAAAAPLCRLYSNVHVDFLEQKVLELEGTSEISSSRPLISGRGEQVQRHHILQVPQHARDPAAAPACGHPSPPGSLPCDCRQLTSRGLTYGRCSGVTGLSFATLPFGTDPWSPAQPRPAQSQTSAFRAPRRQSREAGRCQEVQRLGLRPGCTPLPNHGEPMSLAKWVGARTGGGRSQGRLPAWGRGLQAGPGRSRTLIPAPDCLTWPTWKGGSRDRLPQATDPRGLLCLGTPGPRGQTPRRASQRACESWGPQSV